MKLTKEELNFLEMLKVQGRLHSSLLGDLLDGDNYDEIAEKRCKMIATEGYLKAEGGEYRITEKGIEYLAKIEKKEKLEDYIGGHVNFHSTCGGLDIEIIEDYIRTAEAIEGKKYSLFTDEDTRNYKYLSECCRVRNG